MTQSAIDQQATDSFTVLLSGGVDSATLLALLRSTRDSEVRALHVDYGQGAREAERQSAAAVADHYNAPIEFVSLKGWRFGKGEIVGRNLALLSIGLMASRGATSVIAIGIHGGTPYADCGPTFMKSAVTCFETITAGAVIPSAPFVDRSKVEVFKLARDLEVPLQLTHSCESGNSACGSCASCADRSSNAFA